MLAPHFNTHSRMQAALGAVFLTLALVLTACNSASGTDETSGAAFSASTEVRGSTFDAASATGSAGALIDTSHCNEGYVGASATSQSHLKFLVQKEGSTYSYDLPQDGTSIVCPLTQGDGAYTLRIMQNTEENNYIELYRADAQVALESEFDPYLYPNVYCSYTADSACVKKARSLVKHAKTQGDAVEAICTWVVKNITYDDDKAAKLKGGRGYVPNPDETLSTKSGICFDYASLGAAMLRSQGIPTKIVTGYLSPDNIYHAWIMVYIDGTWQSAQFNIEKNTWSRVDLTFAAGQAGSSDGQEQKVGDGKDYSDRYVY